MFLNTLRIHDFRCLESTEITPAKGVNLIVGENASGKSSLLEAIYFLGRGRSFRRTPPTRLVRRGTRQFSVFADIKTLNRPGSSAGIIQRGQETQIRVGNRRNAPKYDLVTTVPVQIIDPGLHRLLEEGPDERRRYLDWGVFHVEHPFFFAWKRYKRALRQRNHALRSTGSKDAVTAWDTELTRFAELIDQCRRDYVSRLATQLPETVETVLGEGDIFLDYHAGWPREHSFAQALSQNLASDMRSGFTHVGPHRADLKIKLNSVRARDWVSRGQQKVLSAALLVAQAAVHAQHAGTTPVLLIDDIAAELGASYRQALIGVIDRLGVQCFMTFLEAAHIPSICSNGKMFHVEQGTVTPDV